MERKKSQRRGNYSGGRYVREKTCYDKFKDFLRQFIAFMFSNVGVIGLVVGYTIAGAFVFQAIEGEESTKGTADVIRMRNETVLRLWELTHDLNVFAEPQWRNSVSAEILDYQRKVVVAVSNGYHGSDTVEESNLWSFSGAFLYSLTVITTIGYGNVTPHTEWGKIVTILYAIIGMPLFLLFLSNIGDILAKSFKWTYAMCCLCKGCPGGRRRNAKKQEMPLESMTSRNGEWEVNQQLEENGLRQVATIDMDSNEGSVTEVAESEDDQQQQQEDYDPQTVTVPVTLCLSIMVGYVCGGAILFSEWEDWGFLDGSYFCFISLSTIGFGDLVPGDKIYASEALDLSFIFCSMYLMLGMALIAMCFNLMQEEVVHKIRTCIQTFKNMARCITRSSQPSDPDR